MNALLSPWAVAAACGSIILGFLASPNAALWAIGLLALPVAVWLLGGRQAYRVLLWVIAINWLQVIGDIASADLTGSVLSDGSLGPYRVEAILEFVRDTYAGARNAFWNAAGRMAISLVRSRWQRFTSWGSARRSPASRHALLFRLPRRDLNPGRGRRFHSGARAAGSRPEIDQIRLRIPPCGQSIRIGKWVRLAGCGIPCGTGDRGDGVLLEL